MVNPEIVGSDIRAGLDLKQFCAHRLFSGVFRPFFGRLPGLGCSSTGIVSN
jgi:hypothetical protein